MEKTNALRILDKAKLVYQLHSYPTDGHALDAVSVAMAIHQSPDKIFKTLIVIGASHTHYVLIINSQDELDLKKAASALKEKSIEMIQVKDILDLTGYVRGGCSPIGMKKTFKTVFDQRALQNNTLIVSAGRIGLQLEMDTKVLIDFIKADVFELCR
jgi:Cys-tRNA(Pro)/Cys-tRNA(Cys) deacylase